MAALFILVEKLMRYFKGLFLQADLAWKVGWSRLPLKLHGRYLPRKGIYRKNVTPPTKVVSKRYLNYKSFLGT